jgi:hypothetical protein
VVRPNQIHKVKTDFRRKPKHFRGYTDEYWR